VSEYLAPHEGGFGIKVGEVSRDMSCPQNLMAVLTKIIE
jgi:hypothetical protein